ncbi:MAG: mitofilin family membrane protein [Hyphomicrobiales bacterium]|nr:mitofilin family membrane protein [Hyphomicrobiales bacterium]
MTNADDAPEGADKRPRVTLDLKATDMTEPAASSRALPPPRDDAPDAEAPAFEAPRPGQRSSTPSAAVIMTHLLAGIAGGLIALVVAFYGVERFRDRMTVLSAPTAEALRADLAAASARVAALERAPAKPNDEAKAALQSAKTAEAEASKTREIAAALEARIAAVEASLAKSPTATGASAESVEAAVGPVQQRIAEAEAKLEALAKAQNTQRSSAAATALAVAAGNLRRAVATGRAYAAEFDAAAKLGAPAGDMAALAPARETGVKTPEQLEKAFTPLAREALRAEARKEDGGLVSRLWLEAKSIVRVRRTGDVAGDDLDAVLARAETRLRARDVNAAIAELKTVKGESAVILAPWLADAGARAAADAALDQIDAKLLASLKTGSAGQ